MTQDELTACVEPYREVYDLWKIAHRRRITSRGLKAKIRILQQAKSIVESIDPFVLGKWILELLKIGVITPFDAHRLSHAQFPMHVMCIDDAVDYLSTLLKNGRPRNLVLVDCANALAELFKKRTGKSCWERVGKEMAKRFPDALPKADKDKGEEPRLWSYNLAKRSRNRPPELGTMTLLRRDFSEGSRLKFDTIVSFPGNDWARYAEMRKADVLRALCKKEK